MTRRERQLPRDIPVLWESILIFTDTNTVLFERCIQLFSGDELLVITIDDSSSSSDTFLVAWRRTLSRRQLGIDRMPFVEPRDISFGVLG